MRSPSVTVNGQGAGFEEALAMAEKIGEEQGLDRKSVLHLRLLSEELFGMLRGIAGDVSAEYCIESDGKHFEIHMESDVNMTQQMQEQFISASKSGKNEAARSFMGKIRVMIANMILSAKETMPYAMVNTVSGGSMDAMSGETAAVWSMAFYMDEIRKNMNQSTEAREAWDELEKSIVANIADDVKVRTVGNHVGVVVYKDF